MGRFDGKVVWITGGGTGIGRAMALAFAAEGARVAVSGRREDRLAAVVESISAQGGEALAVPVDVTDDAAVDRAAGLISDSLGRLDVAVANAGYAVSGAADRVDAATWRRQLDVNVIGLVNTVRAAMPALREHKGQVVLIGSVAAFVPARRNAPYCASKAAVHAFGEVLSAELRGSGVSCTTLHPGFIKSEIAKVDNEGQFHAERPDKRPAKLMWEADAAARQMVRAIARRQRVAFITGHGRIIGFLARHFPGLTWALLARLS